MSEHTLSSHPKYRPDIDGLRAVAVLSVVAFHAFPAWMSGGFVGVDVFFVISGFLISTIIFENLDRGTFRFSEFYARRIKRIFPALLLVLFAGYAFGWFALLADEYQQLGKHIAGGAGFVSNVILWNEAGYFDQAADTKPLLHLWSLGIEEQFYIVWPLLLWLAWKCRFNVLTLTILVALASFALNVNGVSQDQVATFYAPQTRFWELLCGSLLAWYCLYKKAFDQRTPLNMHHWSEKIAHRLHTAMDTTTVSNTLSCLGALLLAYGFWRVHKHLSFPGGWALVPVLGATCIILAGPHAWMNKTLLSHKWVVWFGLISFPLYLWHWPLLSFARMIASDTPSRTVRCAAVVLSILLAWLTYKFIERPIRLGRSNTLKVPALVLLMTTAGVMGYTTYQYEGFTSRAAIEHFKDNKRELLRTPAQDGLCAAYLGLTATEFYYCRFSPAGAQETIAVVGDSHAHVAFPGIADLAAKHHLNVVLLANSGCPPFIGAPTGSTPKEKGACHKQTHALLNTLVARDDIKKVFLFARGPIYWTGTEPASEGHAELGGSVSLNDYFSGAQKTIDYIAQSGKEVYFVTENPELSFSPQACIARPFRWSEPDCTLTRAEVLSRFKSYDEGVRRLKRATIVDSVQAFCPKDRCLVLHASGALLYADDDHLSISGSHFQAHALLASFLK